MVSGWSPERSGQQYVIASASDNQSQIKDSRQPIIQYAIPDSMKQNGACSINVISGNVAVFSLNLESTFEYLFLTAIQRWGS